MGTTAGTKQRPEDPALEFCRLCREGRLFEAEAWLRAGKPARYEHKNIRCTPLGIAIDRNIHSLVEVLLRNGFRPEPKHLWFAIRRSRIEHVKMMLQHGADLRWIDFREAVFWPHPDLLRLLVEGGADTKTGFPVADVLIRAPRAFLGLYKEFSPRFEHWQLQANVALRHFCGTGSMRGVCLLLWLQADPRAKVPEQPDDDEELWESGLWQACVKGRVDIVKKIGPTPEKDDLDELLRVACLGKDMQLLEYLVGLGANPNAIPTNGETALRSVLWGLEWRLGYDRRDLNQYRHHDELDLLKRLVELGARLNPAVTDEVNFLRRCLLKLRWWDSYELIKFLHQHKFANEGVMTGLLKLPKIREHLKERLPALARLYPAVDKWADKGQDEKRLKPARQTH